MTMSAKWTAVSFLALTALAAGSVAFAGCTVTSGNPTDIDGGTGNPAPDAATGDSSTGETSTAVVCEGNKQTSGDFVNATCQAKLNAVCCAELKGCFNLVVEADAGAADDCNKYAACVDFAQKQPTQKEKEDAQAECDLSAPKSVQDAYGLIEQCAVDNANVECQ
jgi:hypothetical protein